MEKITYSDIPEYADKVDRDSSPAVLLSKSQAFLYEKLISISILI